MLNEKLEKDFKEALKEKEEIKVSVLRMLKGAIFNKEKEKRYKLSKEKSEAELEKMGKESKEAKKLEKESFLTDEEIIDVISSEIKKRKESILLFEKGKRNDLAEKEKEEIKILEKYLPQQLSEEEIKKNAKEAVEKTGAKDLKDMGRVMTELMPKLKGRADGNLISKIVRELLQ